MECMRREKFVSYQIFLMRKPSPTISIDCFRYENKDTCITFMEGQHVAADKPLNYQQLGETDELCNWLLFLVKFTV